MTMTTTSTKYLCRLSLFAVLLSTLAVQPPAIAQPQRPSSAQPASNSVEPEKPRHEPTSIGGELAKEEREATGEEEENSNLKHSGMVKKLAWFTGGDVHKAHMLALYLNFAVIVILVLWVGR